MKRGAKSLPVTSIEDLKKIGTELSRSKMIGNVNPAQGFVIACICHQTGQSFNEYAETYHVVGDRPSMRADTMLANLLDLGGEYKILERSPDRAALWMKYRNAETEMEITAEEIYAEPVAYKGGPTAQMEELKKPFEKRRLKDKYATPRSRMQMLWARLISDAVRAVCPQANRGQYTPEEVEDFDPGIPSHTSHVTAEPAEPEPLETPPYTAEYCPVPGSLLGKRWADMDVETLTFAANELEHESLTDEHRQEIAKALHEKQGDQQ